jgi:hypothetical protein
MFTIGTLSLRDCETERFKTYAASFQLSPRQERIGRGL